jgi:RimJ/RimL family protein N-acetyltransferase
VIETERLILRGWRDEDVPEFVQVTNTPSVMKYLGGIKEPNQLRASIKRQQRMLKERGHCFWLLERRTDQALLGFCGLASPTVADTPIADDVEIGWRLREDVWGQGYAREAATAALAWGWAHLPAPRIVAMTVAANTASWGLMLRLGMVHRPELDFAHPDFAQDHPLSAHVVYAKSRPL